ncbi:MAG: hypothetical protein HY401_04575 [Elusimicrobia bacterium]|nr:hypothetical protein [Elusimicrobiota bacterium]
MARITVPEVEYIASANGHRKAVILSLRDWKRIKETLAVVTDRSLYSSLQRARKQLRQKVRLLTHKEVFGDL